MSDKTLRLIVAAVISLLIVYQIGVIISGLFGMAWGLVSSIAVALISFFSARLARAGGKSSFWFLLPTVLFTVVPILMTLWNVFTEDATLLDRLTAITPFLVGFGLPVILLLVVYFELRKRTISK